VKCANCASRRFPAVTDDVVRWHLSGFDDRGNPFVMGVYPMLLDETCYFLAVDFDGDAWREGGDGAAAGFFGGVAERNGSGEKFRGSDSPASMLRHSL